MRKPEKNKALLAAAIRQTHADHEAAMLIAKDLLDGTYNEGDGPLATPMIALVRALRMAGLNGLADLVMDGEFDD